MSCQREEKQRVAEKVKYKASNLRKKSKSKKRQGNCEKRTVDMSNWFAAVRAF